VFGQLVGVLVVVALGCHAANGPGVIAPRIVAPGVFELDIDLPVHDRHVRGADSQVGVYEVGTCVLTYDAGMYSGTLDQGAVGFPEDYRYRVAPIDGRNAAWAIYRNASKDLEDPSRPFTVEVSMPSLTIEVKCPTAPARDNAIGWLERLHMFRPRGEQHPLDGPSTFSHAPEQCVQTTSPSSDPSEARVRIVVPSSTAGYRLEALGRSETESWPGDVPSVERVLAAGRYTVWISETAGPTVRCRNVEVRAGERTELRVLRYDITDPVVPTANNPVVDWYARSVMMSLRSERRTYHLARVGDRVGLAVVTEVSVSKHLDTDDEVTWTKVGIDPEYFAGVVRAAGGGFEVELDRVTVAAERVDRPLPSHLAWKCLSKRLPVRESTSKPYHVGPVSTEQACFGSRSEWRPAGVANVEVWACGPVDVYTVHTDLAFSPSADVELVGEWNDCHIQTNAYRAR
jgi:hypothetical protein